MIKNKVSYVVRKLLQGQLVVCNTDTVSAILCDARSERAIALMRSIKRREPERPFSVITSLEMLYKNSCCIPKRGECIMWMSSVLLTGKLTVVFPCNCGVFSDVLVSREGIGMRLTRTLFLNAILRVIPGLAASSLNRTGYPTTDMKSFFFQCSEEERKNICFCDINQVPENVPSSVSILSAANDNFVLKLTRESTLTLSDIHEWTNKFDSRFTSYVHQDKLVFVPNE